MKEFYVSDAARFENQSITTYFALAALSQRERKGTGGTYLALTLADKTGSLEARMWDDFADALNECAEGCYVKVQGQISKYQGKFQITLQKMRFAADSEVDSADFVPTTQYDIPEMDAELRGIVSRFTNPHLQRLVLSFLNDPEIGPKFVVAPAAKRLHHAWIGGLLEHVLHLVRVCLATAPFYPEVDPDLLVTGAILHDMGKIRELSWKSSFGYTLEGQLIGHISIGVGMIGEKIAQLNAEPGAEPFPPRLRVVLEHMILAHHGKLEFGSPKLPMTPEAMLLSALDDLEAKFQTLRGEFATARTAGKKPDEVTDWVRSMDRALFDSRTYLAEEKPAPPAQTVELDAKDEDPAATEEAIFDTLPFTFE
ncbi:MAG: OB-fold nucleic acid binding domain-containing protein [Acidobacteriaceae bacterium]|nr:OB-fold nucleic acid binding domain-containing protein [Acidobacteriaceae bacterium]